MNDREIIGAVLDGQTSRFEVLVDRYLGMIRGLCASYVAQPSPCEDLVQETFIDGYTQLGRLRHPERFPAWLARIARNKCISWIRKESRRKEYYEKLQCEPLPLGDDVLSTLTRQELRDYVRNSMKRLPAKTREAMMLCYIEGLSVRDIAAALDISRSAVKKRLQYGREILSSSLWNVVHDTQDTEDDKDKLKKQIMAAVPFSTVPLKASLFGTAVAAKLLTAKAMSIAALVAIIAIAAGWLLVNPITQSEALNAATVMSSPEMESKPNEKEKVSKTDEGAITVWANQPEVEEPLQIQAVQEYEPKIHIHGTIVLANTNEPVSGINIVLNGDVDNHQLDMRSNEEGVFEHFSQGSISEGYSLALKDENYFMKKNQERIYIKENPPEPVQIEVYKLGKITGTVRRPDGTPVPGAKISVRKPGGSFLGYLSADDLGRYTLFHDGGEITFFASEFGLGKSETVTLDLRLDESAEQDLVIPQAARLFFRLAMPDGGVVEKLRTTRIFFELDDGQSSRMDYGNLPREGEWFMGPYVLPGTYNCIFVTSDNVACIIEEIYVSPTDREKRIKFTLEQGPEPLTVRVLDYEGTPVPEQYVSMDRSIDIQGLSAEIYGAKYSLRTKTDAHGQCTFQHLKEGEVSVYTDLKGELLENKIMLPHTAEVVLRSKRKDMPRKVNVNVSVTVPAEENRILDIYRATWHMINKDTGEYQWHGTVVPGDYLLVYTRIGYTSCIEEVTVPDDSTITEMTVELSIEEGGAIYGDILNKYDDEILIESLSSNGQVFVVPEVLESVLRNEPNGMGYMLGALLSQKAKIGDDGTFYVSHLPPGNYFVGVSQPQLFGPWEILANHETIPGTRKFLTGPYEVMANHETGPITVRPGG